MDVATINAEEHKRNQIEFLNVHFEKMEMSCADEDADGDDNYFGDKYTLKRLDDLEQWSIALTPMSADFHFVHKFKGAPTFFPVSIDERLKDFQASGGKVFIFAQTNINPPYLYTYCLNYKNCKFNLGYLLSTMKNSFLENFSEVIEGQVKEGKWKNNEGKDLNAASTMMRLREIHRSAERIYAEREQNRRAMKPIGTVGSRVFNRAGDNGSQGSTPQTTTDRRTITPTAPKKRHSIQSSTLRKKSKVTNDSSGSGLTDIPKDIKAHEEVNVADAKAMFSDFWGKCSDCFIFGRDTKKIVHINKCILAPKEWIIREKEDAGVIKEANKLLHMADLTSKQTICVMPNVKSKPDTWEEVMDGDFYIINGQHSVFGAKHLQDKGIPTDRQKGIEEWQAFVVWSNDADLLTTISKYYNRINHFDNFKPTWGTNLISARHIWLKNGSPKAPEPNKVLRTKAGILNRNKWEVFKKAIYTRFSSIEVAEQTKDSEKKGKKKETNLDLHNEIKIITLLDDSFNLWCEVIQSHASGNLMDPDTCEKFKEKKNWVSGKNGLLNREFFKNLGNMSQEDHKALAEHILNIRHKHQRFKYPKVTMKKISGVKESCYAAKDWIERWKRKQIIQRELDRLQPDLEICDSNGDVVAEKWQEFKMTYCVSSATMRVLMDAPGTHFFSERKVKRGMNKSTREISPYAEAVFKKFLAEKKKFKAPRGRAFMRLIQFVSNKLGEQSRSWETSKRALKLGILDFRQFPNYSFAKDYNNKAPFFSDFMALMAKQSNPGLFDPPAWLWICGDAEFSYQISSFANDKMKGSYTIHHSTYVQAKNERLGGGHFKSRSASQKVALIFLVKKDNESNRDVGKKLREEYIPPDAPMYKTQGKYNELRYRIDSSELRMEFYLQVLGIFCQPGDTVYSILGGGKVVSAGTMLSLATFFVLSFDEKEPFLRIVRESKVLDKRDFAHDAYEVDHRQFPYEYDGKSSGRKGKKKVAEHDQDNDLDDVETYIEAEHVDEDDDLEILDDPPFTMDDDEVHPMDRQEVPLNPIEDEDADMDDDMWRASLTRGELNHDDDDFLLRNLEDRFRGVNRGVESPSNQASPVHSRASFPLRSNHLEQRIRTQQVQSSSNDTHARKGKEPLDKSCNEGDSSNFSASDAMNFMMKMHQDFMIQSQKQQQEANMRMQEQNNLQMLELQRNMALQVAEQQNRLNETTAVLNASNVALMQSLPLLVAQTVRSLNQQMLPLPLQWESAEPLAICNRSSSTHLQPTNPSTSAMSGSQGNLPATLLPTAAAALPHMPQASFMAQSTSFPDVSQDTPMEKDDALVIAQSPATREDCCAIGSDSITFEVSIDLDLLEDHGIAMDAPQATSSIPNLASTQDKSHPMEIFHEEGDGEENDDDKDEEELDAEGVNSPLNRHDEDEDDKSGYGGARGDSGSEDCDGSDRDGDDANDGEGHGGDKVVGQDHDSGEIKQRHLSLQVENMNIRERFVEDGPARGANPYSGSAACMQQDPECPGSCRDGPSVGIRSTSKWLYVVLDLNGILYVCEEVKSLPRSHQFDNAIGPHSMRVPTIVGPKAVFVRPSCQRFLYELSKFAYITVWSSMRFITVKLVCDFLFRGILAPSYILGQESCDKILIGDRQFLTFENSDKPIFLKTMSKQLFWKFPGRYSVDNTIIVDDSPVKHVLNSRWNALFPESWTYKDGGWSDAYLSTVLGPWLYNMHKSKDGGITTYHSLNPLGQIMWSEVDEFYSVVMASIYRLEEQGRVYR